MSEVKAISVTQLARRIRNLLEIEIGDVWVEGEVSNLRKQSSGHWYFSLKDGSAQISCAMFGAKRRVGHEAIEDGARVQLLGEASFYEARGSTQLIVKKAQAVGVGNLQAQFEALKKKLDQEGLFASERKRPLPRFPMVVGIVTSPTGAALQDVRNVLERRSPWLTVVLFPVAVQGKGAERGIAAAIGAASRASEDGLPQPEVLIVGRGGGSLEDLWNFNEEVVARAIAKSAIPVISAVGHEIDFTISDFVADLRAPTPSAAAELVAPDQGELKVSLERVRQRLVRSAEGRLDRLADHLDYSERAIFRQSPDRLLQQPIFRLDRLKQEFEVAVRDRILENEHLIESYRNALDRAHPRERLRQQGALLEHAVSAFQLAAKHHLAEREAKLGRLSSLLNALGPENVLKRGYSLTFDGKGELVRTADQLAKGDALVTKLADGEVRSTVKEKS